MSFILQGKLSWEPLLFYLKRQTLVNCTCLSLYSEEACPILDLRYPLSRGIKARPELNTRLVKELTTHTCPRVQPNSLLETRLRSRRQLHHMTPKYMACKWQLGTVTCQSPPVIVHHLPKANSFEESAPLCYNGIPHMYGRPFRVDNR